MAGSVSLVFSLLSVFMEVVKAALLEEDPPSPKIDGGFRLHPLPQPQKVVPVFLLHSHPSIQQ